MAEILDYKINKDKKNMKKMIILNKKGRTDLKFRHLMSHFHRKPGESGGGGGSHKPQKKT